VERRPVPNDDPPPVRGRGAASPSVLHVEVDSDVPRSPLALGTMRRLALHVLRAERIPQAHLSIQLVGEQRIAQLNAELVGHEGPTDIVTLQHARSAAGAPVVGEVYLAPAIAGENARALGIAPRDEIARLVVHGVLHALGWEHPDGPARTRSAMWKRQEALLRGARRAGILGSLARA
jgi:probable rRNA maturation factor